MTEIMISIKPEWCEKILALQKRWEIRKTMPTSRAIPCQCYIYQTGGGTQESLKDSFLTVSEAESYAAGNTLYRWRISSLVIYHKPRPVSLYGLDRPPQSWCYVRGDHHEES